MAIISANHLSKTYTFYKKEPGLLGTLKSFVSRKTLESHAVNDISFSLKTGELVGFLGPNGAGKTTTLKMLSGIIHPSSGEVTVLGFTPHKREPEYQRQFAIVMGQKNQLIRNLPPQETFSLLQAIYEIPQALYEKQLNMLVKLLGVEPYLAVQAKKLSLGERMKCELIAALLHDPKILFLDEPTIGLDVMAQKNVRDFIKTYNKERKTTILLTSHYMEDIHALCSRVIIINKGSVMYDGSLEALIHAHATVNGLPIDEVDIDEVIRLFFSKNETNEHTLWTNRSTKT